MGNTISKELFTPVTLEDKQLFEDILNSCELYKDLAASEFSFQSFYCWGAVGVILGSTIFFAVSPTT